ncbi:MAG: TerB family tellurite resistance protein [Rhizobiaceae bacterium]
MSIWTRVGEFVSRVSTNALSGVVEAVHTVFEGDPETRRRVAFSIAMIALSAKMAKADGVVTQDEVKAFQQIFEVPPDETKHVARLYNLAKSDVAGFEAYAERMARLCGTGHANCPMLEDILDGLFHIAKADGVVHERELVYLGRVAEIFQFDQVHFNRLVARHAITHGGDPFVVLGVSRDADRGEIRRRYHELVRENHPDRLIARGVPEEFHAIANERLAAINAAYEAIEASVPA